MREIIDHKVSPLNEALKVVAIDPPGPGGANHCYSIFADESKVKLVPGMTVHVDLLFQLGGVADSGVNGISGEALLAVVIDRLRAFQGGPFSCKENSVALTHLETAMLWLHKRTTDRLHRGVEGRSLK